MVDILCTNSFFFFFLSFFFFFFSFFVPYLAESVLKFHSNENAKEVTRIQRNIIPDGR